jgi:HK97 family phage portal protein
MRVPAVAAAVGHISEPFLSLPCFLYRRGPDGARDRAADDPRYQLIHDFSADFTTAGQLREQLVRDAMLRGNGIAYVVRVDGRPIEIVRLKPDAVTIEADEFTGDPVFTVRGRNGSRVLDRRDVLHVPALSVDGVKGIAPISLARDAIALAAILEEAAARLFANGARPSGVLTTDRDLSDTTLTRVKELVERQATGASAGRTLALPLGFKFAPTGMTSTDSQFLEMRNLQVVEIARAFRIPPVMLWDFSRATWSNSEVMTRLFVQFTLSPWLERFEAAYTAALIPPEERDRYFIEFGLDEFMKADTQARAAAYASFRTSGVMTSNEVRRREGLPDRPDGDSLQNPATSSPPRSDPPKEAA